MRRTSVGDLILPFVIVGLAVYLVFRFFYGSIPPLQYVLPIPIAIWPSSSSRWHAGCGRSCIMIVMPSRWPRSR